MFLMTFESFFFFFFIRYDCNKRYIKTLEHLQIYFDRLCELSYQSGLIIFQSFIFVYFLTLELFWTLYIQTFFCFDVRFYGFFAQYVPKKFHKFIFSIYLFLPFALFIFEGYTSHIPRPLCNFTKFKLFWPFLGNLSTLHQLCMFCIRN